MRILVAGEGRSDIHEVAVVEAFCRQGHSVESFYWYKYFRSNNVLSQPLLRAQNKFIIGPAVNKLNRDFVKCAIRFAPELIFVYRGTHLKPAVIASLKRIFPSCEIYGYNNDDPFSKEHPFWLWRFFKKCIPIYDIMFAYRKHNIAEYVEFGAKDVKLLMPWFIPEKDKPKMPSESIKRKFDVVFIGHFENDQRIKYLENVAQTQVKFGLFGPDWGSAPSSDWLQQYQPIFPLRGETYRSTLLSSKIALCFMSTLNRDTYTRRCFEIPAMGVFLLCQFSPDLAELFDDGVDAVFFHNPEDLLRKIRYYLDHEVERKQIAANGLARVIRDQHDIDSRMCFVLNQMQNRNR